MRLAVMGAGGFIGLHVGEYAKNHGLELDLYSRIGRHGFLRNVFPLANIISSQGSEFFDRATEYSSVIYLSSSFSSTSEHAVSTAIVDNLRNSASFFEQLSARNPNCHVVFASSGGTVYGPGHSRPIPESTAVNPTTPYGLGKLLTEETLKFFSAVHGLPVTVMRIANPVGYWQLRGRHGFISAAIRCALTGEALTVFGDGSNARDYFDVDDLAELLLKVATISPSQAFRINNVGSGIERSEIDVIREVEDALNSKINVGYSSARQTDLKYAVLDARQTARDYNWHSRKPLPEIIMKILRRVEASGLPQRD